MEVRETNTYLGSNREEFQITWCTDVLRQPRDLSLMFQRNLTWVVLLHCLYGNFLVSATKSVYRYARDPNNNNNITTEWDETIYRHGSMYVRDSAEGELLPRGDAWDGN